MRKKYLFLLCFLFFPCLSYGLVTSSVQDGCAPEILGITDTVFIEAVFEPISITCQSGYYLAANSTTCTICPNGATCSGGTYTFNETRPQGVVFENPFNQNEIGGCISNFLGIADTVTIEALFELANITCQSGYYLPAGTDVCVICPNGATCSGGTYNFSETRTQGIVFENPFNQNETGGCISNFLGVTDTVTIEALYEPKTITINYNDGNGNNIQSSCVYDELITIPADEPTRAGYTFSGWKVERN